MTIERLKSAYRSIPLGFKVLTIGVLVGFGIGHSKPADVPASAAPVSAINAHFSPTAVLDPTQVQDYRHADPCAVIAQQIVDTGQYPGYSVAGSCVGEEDGETVNLLIHMHELAR